MLTSIQHLKHHLSRGETYHEATIDAKTQAHEHKNKSDLIRPESQGARPKSQCRSQRINDCKAQRECEDVMHGKLRIFGQMGYNHSTNRVRIEHASIEDEGDEMVT